ncbi:peptidoglycan-recognition protein 2-like [Macrosteles quadrilineatus]|uniref:peptidoglycan-recognition protein 2-like n=1 Tax=Macrosteles quadrilineatus TaxID=74068 RepID=UPI0023E0A626|nr:peptidoglycan-recognition protein 2-like [Macrosteles quadrilineatus]
MAEENKQSDESESSKSITESQPRNVNDSYDIYDTDIKAEDFTQTFDPGSPSTSNQSDGQPENADQPLDDAVDELRPLVDKEKIVYDLEARPITPPPPPQPEVPPDGVNESVPRATVIYRGGWGALPPKDPPAPPLVHPIDSVIFLHTGPGTEECHNIMECTERLQQLQRKHMYERGMPDIQYNFMVTSDNTVYEGRGWHRSATKDLLYKHYDGRSLDICFIGDFTNRIPNKDMTMVALSIINEGIDGNYLKETLNFVPVRRVRPITINFRNHFVVKKSNDS